MVVKKSSYDLIIEEHTKNETLHQMIIEFIKMRKLIKKPMTDYALRRMLNELEKLANNDVQKLEILNQSIVNNWLSVYPLKENFNKTKEVITEVKELKQEQVKKEEAQDLEELEAKKRKLEKLKQKRREQNN